MARRPPGPPLLPAAALGRASEHRAHGVAGALGDLGGRRHLRRLLGRKGEVSLDDQLLGPYAAQAATVDPRGRAHTGAGITLVSRSYSTPSSTEPSPSHAARRSVKP